MPRLSRSRRSPRPASAAARRARTLLPALLVLAVAPSARAQSFVNFEAGQVRPLALSPDGSRLFATNTPDGRVEIFGVEAAGLTHQCSVPVGLEPVALAAASETELWVVNHLSDSVSIVDITSCAAARVRRTLLVGDEPRDIVFAGANGQLAFITTAHRGQNHPLDPEYTSEGVGRADVWVFDATNLGTSLEGDPETIITLFGDTPRGLAVSRDGSRVYAAVFHSGNRTTTVNEGLVCDGGATALGCTINGNSVPGGLPGPNTDANNVTGPETGLIVHWNPLTSRWEDPLGRNWNNAIRFSLPDLDVFEIDAAASPPVERDQFAGVGTVLFNLAVNPVNDKVYVTNTEAGNAVRFEGPGTHSTTVRGNLHRSRVTIIDPALGAVTPRPLNSHIDYGVVPSPAGVAEKSLATPVGIVISADGATAWIAAFGSSRIGVFDTSELEAGTFTPSVANQIALSGGGPSGLVLDEASGRLYVLTRFDNGISTVDIDSRSETAHTLLHNPEPSAIVEGRPFLYDALATSSNGEASCSSCHVFGDLDSLAWDLGNPDDEVLTNANPFEFGPLGSPDFHPLKGPMTTQSLRGMAGHGPMHWRGDRTGALEAASVQPNSGAFNEDAAFKKFNPAFVGLVGRDTTLTNTEMQKFTDFILSVTYPPNPNRALDNALSVSAFSGEGIYFGPASDGVRNCNGCHTLDLAQGFFGTDGESTFENETQHFKVAHLRNMYQKVGMFGLPQVPFLGGADSGFSGDQIRGFGFLHDGSIPRLFDFFGATVFGLTDTQQRQMEAFALEFPSNMAPVVGQQVTRTFTNGSVANPRINLLVARAAAGECDVVVKGMIAGAARGAVRLASGAFATDRESEGTFTQAQLLDLVTGSTSEQTWTCAPPGSGERIGIDRDEDGFRDRDELDQGTDPASAASYPGAPAGIRTSSFLLRDDNLPPFTETKRTLTFKSAPYQGVASGVTLPAPGSTGDPTAGGATLEVYLAAGGAADVVSLDLPAAHWSSAGTGPTLSYRYTDPDHADGPVGVIKLSPGKLLIRGKGADLPALSSAPLGEVGLRLTLGSAAILCATAPPREPALNFDNTARWQAVPNTAAPSSCPTIPGAGSASHAFLGTTPSLVE